MARNKNRWPIADEMNKKRILFSRETHETYEKGGRVGCFIFATRACHARLACLAHNSRTTRDLLLGDA